MAYTPQELAAMQAGLDPRAYYRDLTAEARAGLVDPSLLASRGASTIPPGTTGAGPQVSRMDQAQAFAQGALQNARQTARGIGPRIMAARGLGRGALATGLLGGVPEAISELQAGRPAGAAGALGGGAALGLLGAGLTMIPHPVAKVAGVALPVVGSFLGAPAGAAVAVEGARQGITGQPTTGREGEYGTERARARQLAEDQISTLDRTLGVQTSNIKDLSQFYSDQSYADFQRMNPLIQKNLNNALIRQQALLNTQGQNYAMLGTLATAGRLATGAQVETGATIRQAMASNPFSAANLAAPGISFG